MHILILAGGGGTRLWPLSRQDFPKQFLHFGDHQSLLQKTVSRFALWPITSSLSISTNKQYAPLVREQLKKTDSVRIVIEPARKNTAPAIAFAIKELDLPLDSVILVLPSDHLIEPQSIFLDYLSRVVPHVQKDQLVLFGIHPTKPETGYGYIQVDKQHDANTFEVKRFVEKPDKTLAEQYIASEDYYWNSGMFACTVRHFWKLIAQHAPIIDHLCEQNPIPFEKMPDISFDYAVLEKTSPILVCPLPVVWSDVGCWDSVYESMEKDKNQNVKVGNVVEIDTKNSLILGGKRLISTIGLEDMLIVETEDATFISKKGESQKVKSMVLELVKSGKREGDRHAIERNSWGSIESLRDEDDYSIQKITIDPQMSWCKNGDIKWMILKGDVEDQGSAILNLTQESVELLVVRFHHL